MAQSSVLPSMRGILSGGNWKILKVTPGRSSPNCTGRNTPARTAQTSHRLGINLLNLAGPQAGESIPSSAARFHRRLPLHTLVFIRPSIRAERRGGEARRIVEIAALGVVVPGVAHRGRRANLGARDHHRIALDPGFRGHELAVGAGDGEPLQRPVFGYEAAAEVRELQSNGIARDLHRFVRSEERRV